MTLLKLPPQNFLKTAADCKSYRPARHAIHLIRGYLYFWPLNIFLIVGDIFDMQR